MMSRALPSSIDLETIFAENRCQTSQRSRTTSRAKKDPSMLSARIPKSSPEWKRALADVKRDHLSRRFRSCATRCQDLLDGAKTSSATEAAHLTYLHFYAASALEMQVRSLHHTSPYRAELIDRARDHYHRASVLAEAESGAATRLLSTRSPSPAASHSPSLSVGSSIASGASGASEASTVSSPVEDFGPRGPRPARAVKHVACQYALSSAQAHEPYIRPDSPTLGLDEYIRPHHIEKESDHVTLLELHPTYQLSGADDSTSTAVPCQRTQSLLRYASVLTALHRQIILVHLPALETPSAVALPPSNDEMRVIEIQARIERLRARGWNRRRFDLPRYEALREAALADLME